MVRINNELYAKLVTWLDSWPEQKHGLWLAQELRKAKAQTLQEDDPHSSRHPHDDGHDVMDDTGGY